MLEKRQDKFQDLEILINKIYPDKNRTSGVIKQDIEDERFCYTQVFRGIERKRWYHRKRQEYYIR